MEEITTEPLKSSLGALRDAAQAPLRLSPLARQNLLGDLLPEDRAPEQPVVETGPRVEDLQVQIETLRESLEQETQRVDHVRKAGAENLRQFKRQVGRRALKEKFDRDWCDELDDVLDDLGIDLDDLKTEARITISFTVKSLTSDPDHGSDWWESSVRHDVESDYEGNGDRIVLTMDEDHSSVDFSSVRIESVDLVDND